MKNEIAVPTLYVSDLDGTLLNRNDHVSDYSSGIINNLIDKGLPFTYATARSLSSATLVTRGLKLHLPVIVYNGAFIMDSHSGQIIDSNYFSSEEKCTVSELLTDYNISPLVYSFIDGVEKVSWYPEKENDGFRRYIGNRRGDRRFNPMDGKSDLYRGNNFYYTCIGEKDELIPIYEALQGNPDFNCILHQELYRPEYWCEIMPRQATKANAIEKLKSRFNFKKLVSFGDGVNDLPMFRISDECYAVENAVPELKRSSTGIIEDNDKDGVAKWLLENG
ncbi:MAG: HAD hydrolase family protein [Spirochaetales bacterium]|nr:HAD hydrolase family protein [Spirochaetales bacterium]